MYKNDTINELAREYIKNRNDKIFEELLLTELSALIDSQLAQRYSSIKSFWGDMKQDVFEIMGEQRNPRCNKEREFESAFL